MRNFVFLASFIFLASCANEKLNFEDIQKAPNTGNVFNDILREEYISLAQMRLENGDKEDAKKYLNKANLVAQGIVPELENVYNKDLPLSTLTELLGAKYFVESSFVNGAKRAVPDTSAIAQASFDCWVEQEEDKNIKVSLDCKKDFNNARATLEKVIEDIKIRKQSDIEAQKLQALQHKDFELKRKLALQKLKLFKLPEPSLIFFQTNSTKVGITGKNILIKVAQDIRKFKPRKVIVSGHTDNVGSYTNNMKLAMKRGVVVAQYLTKQLGVPEYLIDVKAYGENSPRDKSSKQSNVRNRYVKITLIKDDRVYY